MTYTWAGNAASGNAYRLRPVGDLSDSGLVPGGVVPEFSPANPRPTAPPEVGGSLQVAAFNVLNYFLTLDADGNLCGPTGFEAGCRGAEDAEELERQCAKLLEALLALDADVLGIVEVENTTGVEPLADIVAGLNEIAGEGTYDYIETGTVGTDVIKVGLIYQPAAVTPLGDPAVLDKTVDPRFDSDDMRPSLAHSFTEVATGEVFTVVVNHFKSKGCGGATGADADQGDGQGCFNATRTAAAQALRDWLAGRPTGVPDDDVLIVGDLNSYAKEDPIDVLVEAGYVDLAALFVGEDAYSYVFDGQWGYLDYALASPPLAAQVTGAAEYHINADEPAVLDYNTNFKTVSQQATLYAPDEFRTSDHDPVLVGLALDGLPGSTVTATPSRLWPPNHMYRTVDVTGRSAAGLPLTVTIVSVTSSEPDCGGDFGEFCNDIVQVDDDTLQLRSERYSDAGRTYTIVVTVTDGTQTVFETLTVRVAKR
jgi:predicted extracellular nuclease